MRKIVLVIILPVIVLLFFMQAVFADGEPARITEAYAMKGKLFYCDTPTSRVVLTEISPVLKNDVAAAVAKEAEYLEIRISPNCMRMQDGSVITMEYLNMYADSDVWFIVTRDENWNLMIPYFRFQ